MNLLRILFGRPPLPPLVPPSCPERKKSEERLDDELAALQESKKRLEIAIERAAPAAAISRATERR